MCWGLSETFSSTFPIRNPIGQCKFVLIIYWLFIDDHEYKSNSGVVNRDFNIARRSTGVVSELPNKLLTAELLRPLRTLLTRRVPCGRVPCGLMIWWERSPSKNKSTFYHELTRLLSFRFYLNKQVKMVDGLLV